jgi:uncharacterized membrane protein YkvA (DUF1232 family)
MAFNLDLVRRVALDVPRNGKLAYCLLRDDRVPLPPKVALLGALGLIVSPIDFPKWIPVLGDFDLLALGVLAVKVFVDACPEEIVREHREALRAGDSHFDRDMGTLLRGAGTGAGRIFAGLRGRAPAGLLHLPTEERTA